MKCSMMLRHIWGPVKWVLTRSLTLICVSYLLAADVKRVPQDEALKAVTSKTKPAYNGIASQLKLSGSVDLDVIIAEDGTVETVTVVRGNPILAKLATDAIKQWKFIPFKADGKAIKVVSEIVMQFNHVA